MKLLITGCRGMLGQDLVPSLKESGFEPQCVDIAEMDITKKNVVLDHVVPLPPYGLRWINPVKMLSFVLSKFRAFVMSS